MTTQDLIARLRSLTGTSLAPALMVQAANHIEAQAKEIGQYPEIQAMLMKENKELRAEVEQLKKNILDELPTLEKMTARFGEVAAENITLQSRLTALEGQKPEFWWRPFDDGSYLGPLHDDSIEEVRKLSQEWKPLYLAAGAAPQQAEPVQPESDVAAHVLSSHLRNIRCVKPLSCPQCHALWLFWPREQSGFATDTLSVKSATHCDYCENARADQLLPLDRVQSKATPLPDHEIVTMYAERPTSDAEMVEFAREIEAAHGIKQAEPKEQT